MNNLSPQEIKELNAWASQFTQSFSVVSEDNKDWQTVKKIYAFPKEEFRGKEITFPACFSKLQTLTFLRIEAVIIPEIPEVVTQLSNLEFLFFNGLGIESVPESIGNLTKLKILNLNDNKISVIPATIANLLEMEEMGLSNNNLDELPDVFLQYGKYSSK